MEWCNGCVDISYNAGLNGIDSRGPLGICIGRIPVIDITAVLVVAGTYLSALYLYVCIAQHLSVLGAAIDRSGNKSIITDYQMGRAADGKQVGVRHTVAVFVRRVCHTFSGAEDIAIVVVGGRARRVRHQLIDKSHLSAADDDLCQASIRYASLRLAYNMVVGIDSVTEGYRVKGIEGSNRTQLTTAIDTAAYMAAGHVDLRVASDDGCIGVCGKTPSRTIDGA